MGDDLAGIQSVDSISEPPHKLQLVLDDQDASSGRALQPVQSLEHLEPLPLAQTRSRLVQKENLGPAHKGPADINLLLIPIRQIPHDVAQEFADPERRRRLLDHGADTE